MHFFSVAAVFLAGASSVLTSSIDRRDDTVDAVTSIVHVTAVEIVTVAADGQTITKNDVFTKYHTVHADSPPPHSISMPALKPYKKQRKPKSHPKHSAKKVHTKHHGKRDVVETIHQTVIETVLAPGLENKVHTKHVKSTVVVHKTKSAKTRNHTKPTLKNAMPDLKAVKKSRKSHKKNKHVAKPQKEKRSFGSGWFS